jgi:hypothetical protein
MEQDVDKAAVAQGADDGVVGTLTLASVQSADSVKVSTPCLLAQLKYLAVHKRTKYGVGSYCDPCYYRYRGARC